MGMIFQNAALFDSMPVLDNVMFPLDMFSSENYARRKKRAEYCLDRVNLLDSKAKYPDEISGGMQKRVAIARAIAMNPKYLFCDEPNSGLDPKTSLVIDELIHSITQESSITTIINTHEIINSDNERLNSFVFASDLFRKVRNEMTDSNK